MPSINIVEKDLTNPGRVPYENFSVVVPVFFKELAEIDITRPSINDVDFTDNSTVESNKAAATKLIKDFINELMGVVDNALNEISESKVSTPEDDISTYYSVENRAKIAAIASAARAKITSVTKDTVLPKYTLANIVVEAEKQISSILTTAEASAKALNDAFDENDIFECKSLSEFKAVFPDSNVFKTVNKHKGEIIAQALLSLGYTVLIKGLHEISDFDISKFEELKDKSLYDFRYIISGAYDNISDTAAQPNTKSLTELNNVISDIATAREDCTALLDVAESVYTTAAAQSEAINAVIETVNELPDSKYAAAFIPTITYNNLGVVHASEIKMPAAFHYLACNARIKANDIAEWYAVSGFQRGICSYGIKSVSRKFGDTAINCLEARTIETNKAAKAINVIATIKGNYYLWGNRTLASLIATQDLTASHFLNIRQLCTTLKKELYVACRSFSFDPNSDTLWANFQNAIRPTLDRMKADQGITDYKIIKVKTNEKAKLKILIRIVPIEAVEDFDITINLEDSLDGKVNVETVE